MTSEKQGEFLAVLEPNMSRLWRFCLATARNTDDAKDLMSETILATYERFHTIRDARAFTSFLFTIATRIERHRKRRGALFGVFDEKQAAGLQSTEASPETSTELAVLRDAIDALPTKQREAVMLFEISGFSLIEIREIQGGTLSGVKSRLRRGRRELARKLGAPLEEQPPASYDKKEFSSDKDRGDSYSEVINILSYAIHE